MKKLTLLIFFISLFTATNAQKIYNTTSGEMIFGFSNAAYNAPTNAMLPNGNTNGSIADNTRFTIWFHLGSYWHYDFNDHIGIYTGISNRNIGFITKEACSNNETTSLLKWKRRAYAVGMPLAIKLGSFSNDFYFFGGGQYELLYNYKEKEFLPSGKRKYSEWFSQRVNMFLPSVFVGVHFPKGLSVKVTYSLNDMMNKDYSYLDGNNIRITPYKYMDSKLIYISLFQSIRIDRDTYNKVIMYDYF